MDYISVKQAAELWGIDASRVGKLAREGRIEGAKIVGRNWLIPHHAQKPLDGRTRTAKEEEYKANSFRFPLFVNAPADSFSPPLNEEEVRLRQAQIDFYACNFEKSRAAFDELANQSKSIYIRLISYFYLCSLSIEVYSGERYTNYFGRLRLELAMDFPYKKDISVVEPWLYSIMVQPKAVSNTLNFDPLYDYSPSVQSLIACLSVYHLTEKLSSKSAIAMLDAYEMICRSLQQSGYFYESCELHFLLFLAYYSLMKNDQMLHHLKNGLSLAKEHKLYIIPASYEFYYQDAFAEAFESFPSEFAEQIRHYSALINSSLSAFSVKFSVTNIYATLSKEDYRYLVFAFQGNSNSSIARTLHISQRTVAERYAALYAKLGVAGKHELVDLCAKSIFSAKSN